MEPETECKDVVDQSLVQNAEKQKNDSATDVPQKKRTYEEIRDARNTHFFKFGANVQLYGLES